MRDFGGVANPDRLSPLDASFLAFEDAGAHMHVGSVLVFEGEAPDYERMIASIERRLHLVPRYRQRLAWPALQGRPVWVDDPHFNPSYHVRHTALPDPAGYDELKRLAGRVFAQRLDRSKPLWEMWLVDHVGDGCFAMVTKTHHALVDGVSGVDIASVMFDLDPDPDTPPQADRPWHPRPEPSTASLLADLLAERATAPLTAAQEAAKVLSDPVRAGSALMQTLGGIGSIVRAGVAAPASPINRPIGPHRRFTWMELSLERAKAIKSSLGGTVNDVVLAAVAGGLRSWLLAEGHEVGGMTLRAMVPMSTRAVEERGALGNRVTTMYAPLPVGIADPRERFRLIHEAMAGLKESGQAVGADVLTRMAGFAPPTILSQAARLQGRQRLFNLTVTNVPGPQFPLYMMGRRLLAIHPQVPLTRNTSLGIAIMSYDGNLFFGLLSDYDALPDLEDVGAALRASVEELAELAGLEHSDGSKPRPRRRRAAART